MALGFLTAAPSSFSATAGDDWRLQTTLRDNGAAKDFSAGTISAALLTLAGDSAVAETAQSSATTGATWASGVIVLAFTSAATLNLDAGTYLLEVQSTVAGVKTTWPLMPVTVQVGIIV